MNDVDEIINRIKALEAKVISDSDVIDNLNNGILMIENRISVLENMMYNVHSLIPHDPVNVPSTNIINNIIDHLNELSTDVKYMKQSIILKQIDMMQKI